ncbi:SlyX family protein [uncultured Desulfovibrio sp.]|uniref:SlyX family protein n=1 Tax=uncultured Desulfovibrio sp. TaxID=167968 RepID=UPI002632CDBD|nr:SlyX family protein [uncultured Desulfovibrio sp.]
MCHDARLIRLEEQAVFQERRLEALNEALIRQQRQLDEMERQLGDMRRLLRLMWQRMDQEGDAPENSLPPHYMPERY